jgi:hypothetical protein
MDTSDITAMISAILLAHDSRRETRLWQGTALVAVSDADDPGFRELKTTVSPTHRLPEDYLPGARSVLSWFIPFDRSVPESNEPGRLCSRRWAEAYRRRVDIPSPQAVVIRVCLSGTPIWCIMLVHS